LMYWDISIKKVVVQSCMTKLSVKTCNTSAQQFILPSSTDRSIVLISVLRHEDRDQLLTRSIPGINNCRMGTRCFAPG
jgi:hypothetical protein